MGRSHQSAASGDPAGILQSFSNLQIQYIDFTRICDMVFSFYIGRLELPLKSVAKLRCRKIWKLALRDAVAGGNHLDGAIRTGKRGRWRALPESVMSKNIGTLEVVCTQWPQEPSNSNRGTDKWK